MKPLARNGNGAITNETIDNAERIVGVMGPEPFMRALDNGAQIVLGGRSSDPALFAAVAMRAQLPPAQAWYAGKMLECGATPSIPKGHDRSEEHTSELQSLMRISYAVFCLKKKKDTDTKPTSI